MICVSSMSLFFPWYFQWFPSYFHMIALSFPCDFPHYFTIMFLLCSYYFPIISQLFTFWFPIISLIFRYFVLIIFLLFPEYFTFFLIISLLPHCFPIISISFPDAFPIISILCHYVLLSQEYPMKSPKKHSNPAWPLSSGPGRSVEVKPGVRHLDKLEPRAMAKRVCTYS